MELRNIGVVSPGDMGQAVAGCLKAAGYGVYTALEGRSPRTRALALEAGLQDAGTLDELVQRCDMILSILNPAAAVEKAEQMAAAMQRTGRRPVYVDCNAVAPATVNTIAEILARAGAPFIDAGILGAPPRGKARTRVYVSGPHADVFVQIQHPNLLIRKVGTRLGDASALKMCYGAVTKGAVALGIELMIAARKLGVADELDKEFMESIPEVHQWILDRVVTTPPKAYRWVPEMNEIARTFGDVGLTPKMFEGAADLFEHVATTRLGKESPEEARAQGRDGRRVVELMSEDTPDPK